jgi:hypothetical protein
MYVSIGSIEMHSLINTCSCGGENKIALKVDIVLGLICSISMHKRIINPYKKPTDMHI